MRILFIGDPHIKTDNHDEIDILLLQLETICDDEKVDQIVIGGDLMHYHERIFTQALNKTLEFVRRLSIKCPVDILVGNHDMINNQQFLTSNHWLNVFHSFHNVTVIDKPLKRISGEFVYLLCPYVFPGRFIEALETVELDWKTCHLIFAHQEFKGCKMGSIISSEGDDWKIEYPQVISGHIHDNQKINNIYYPGSPLQHAFGDTDKRVVCIFDKDIRDIELNVPKKKIVKTTIDDLANLKTTLSNHLKLKIKATTEEFKLFKQTTEYKEYTDKGVKIQLDKIENHSIETENKSFQSLLQDMVEKDGDSLLKKIYIEMIK